MIRYLALMVIGTVLVAGCNRPPPPRSTNQFVDNPMLLEAAMVRCAQDREQSRYDAECLNARAAAERIQVKEEADRQAELEEQSERKRKGLRRTQAAAAEARRRALLNEEKRKEAEYLAQFGELPPPDTVEEVDEATGNLPIAVIPEADEPDQSEQAAETVGSDLEAIREELQRRAEEGSN
jgi:hypothetical protein